MPQISRWVRFKTSKGNEGSWNLLSDKNLRRVKVKPEEIIKMKTFFDVPGKLYAELGVASETHPCAGSIGVWLDTCTGHRASIQGIIYNDFNPYKKHYSGSPHWNHEGRFIDIEGNVEYPVKDVDFHTIEDSDKITISFDGKKKIVTKKK